MNDVMKDGLIYVVSHWCAQQEIPQSEVIDVVYRVLVEAKLSEGPYSIPELKQKISKIYADTLGYEHE